MTAANAMMKSTMVLQKHAGNNVLQVVDLRFCKYKAFVEREGLEHLRICREERMGVGRDRRADVFWRAQAPAT